MAGEGTHSIHVDAIRLCAEAHYSLNENDSAIKYAKAYIDLMEGKTDFWDRSNEYELVTQ